MSLKLTTHRSLFPAIRTAKETSALRTTSKRSNPRKVYLTYILTILDTITLDGVYVIFVEAVNKMARKCKRNGKTLNLMFLCTGQIF